MFVTIIKQYMYQTDAIYLKSTANFSASKIASSTSLHFQTSYPWCNLSYYLIAWPKGGHVHITVLAKTNVFLFPIALSGMCRLPR